MPDMTFEAEASDLPVLETTQGDVIDSGQELPEG
jgi:hypothetical protein